MTLHMSTRAITEVVAYLVMAVIRVRAFLPCFEAGNMIHWSWLGYSQSHLVDDIDCCQPKGSYY